MSTSRIIMIVAMSPQRIIGGPEGGLPWPRIPEDFKHFKKETMGHPLVVGNTTFKEFPKPLPGRFHSVVSRKKTESNNENVLYSPTPDDALIEAKNRSTGGKVFIIGGATIYDVLLGLADEIILTKIQIDLKDGPTFPRYQDLFHLKEIRRKKGDHDLNYEFQRWVRNPDENDLVWSA
jgi:dihydrofolate reductase